MIFPTITFFLFFVTLLAVLVTIRKHEVQKLFLFAGSCVFYMWWNPAFILLLLGSTIIDYYIARRMDAPNSQEVRRILLTISIVANLGLLGFFKYANLFQDGMFWLVGIFGEKPSWTTLNIVLPVGISFYTFQTMSYTIDVYRRQLPASRSLLDFALFVSFFPQLVAGPIVRAADFLPQLQKPAKMCFDRTAFFLFLRGLAKKVLVADNLGQFVDAVFIRPGDWPSSIVLLATLAFAIQIYCDFSGYSEMAIALARMLGYELPVNFDRPYFATNPIMFWRRWHISLSTWLRDYLYIPLGGNRYGIWTTCRNLMITMTLGGLWHGANWNFLWWGFTHGVALLVHRGWVALKQRYSKLAILQTSMLYRIVCCMMLNVFLLLTWIMFRVGNLSEMQTALKKVLFFDFNFQIANIGLGDLSFFSMVGIIVAFIAAHSYGSVRSGIDLWLVRLRFPHVLMAAAGIGVLLTLFWPTTSRPFIYFQF